MAEPPEALTTARSRLEELGARPVPRTVEREETAGPAAPAVAAVPAAVPVAAPAHAATALTPGAHPTDSAKARLAAIGARPGRIGEGAAVVGGGARAVEGKAPQSHVCKGRYA